MNGKKCSLHQNTYTLHNIQMSNHLCVCVKLFSSAMNHRVPYNHLTVILNHSPVLVSNRFPLEFVEELMSSLKSESRSPLIYV